MQGLKSFMLDAHAPATVLHYALGGSEGLWKDLDILREQREWEEFEVKTDSDRVFVVSVGDSETLIYGENGELRARRRICKGGERCDCWTCLETR
jgi:hypothetical protein